MFLFNKAISTQLNAMLQSCQISGMLSKTQISGMLSKTQISGMLSKTQISGMLSKTQISGMLSKTKDQRKLCNIANSQFSSKQGQAILLLFCVNHCFFISRPTCQQHVSGAAGVYEQVRFNSTGNLRVQNLRT